MKTMAYTLNFTNAYIEVALWTSVTDAGEPMDHDHNDSDLAPETLDTIQRECTDFYALHADTWRSVGMSDDQAGHDFWLTRNRHGAGFWDRGLGTVGEALTRDAEAYGSSDLYIGDDGKVYAT